MLTRVDFPLLPLLPCTKKKSLPFAAAAHRQAKMPDHSAPSLSGRSRSRSAGGISTVNGITRTRRQKAVSVPRTLGRSLATSQSLNWGVNLKKFWRMNRATIGSSSGHRFDFGFVKVPVEIGFDRGDHAGAVETRKICRDVVVVLLDEQRFDRLWQP